MSEKKIIPLPLPALDLGARNDDDLMLLSSAGRRDAFGTLVERYYVRTVALCGRLTGNAGAAEEIAQEVWLDLWDARRDYRPRGRFSALLYTAVRNRCRNHVRDRQRRRRWMTDADDPQAVVSERANQLEEILEAERRRRLEVSVARLPNKYREALVLRFAEGLEYRDIAQIVGRSEAGVRTRVHQALRLLRTALVGGGE